MTQGKGAPTPSRKEAEAERRRRLQDTARGKHKPRGADRAAAKADRRVKQAEVRERMRAGDDRFLSARDRGPARRYARDLVDSQRSAGEFFLYLAIAVLVMGLFPALVIASQVLLFALIFGVVGDSIRVHRRVTRRVKDRFGDAEGTHRIGGYAVMRALTTRRMRLPAPQRKPGDDPDAKR